MKIVKKLMITGSLLTAAALLSGCKPQVYSSVGIESTWGHGPRLTGSISVGGRVH